MKKKKLICIYDLKKVFLCTNKPLLTSHFLSFFLSLFLSLSRSLFFSMAVSVSLFLSVSLSFSVSLSLSLFLTLSLCLSISHSVSVCFSASLPVSLFSSTSVSLCFILSFTLYISISYSYTQEHICTYIPTLYHILSVIYPPWRAGCYRSQESISHIIMHTSVASCHKDIKSHQLLMADFL